MTQNKLILIFLMIILLAAAAHGQRVQPGNVVVVAGGVPFLPDLDMIVESVSPEPVEPGEDVTVKVRLVNNGGGNAEKLSVKLDAKPPFIHKIEEGGFTAPLCAGCSRDNTYYLVVDSDAESGIYPIVFNAFVGETQVIFDKKVNIDVRGRPDLVFITRAVDEVVPNSRFSSVLTVENVGTGEAREIKLSPHSQDFVVLGSSMKTIEELNPSETADVPFEFTASENIDADVYHIPVEISYLDEKGDLHKKTEDIGARVINYGELNIDSIKITGLATDGIIVEKGEPFSIIARVENVGYGDAEFISAQFECPFKGIKKAYVGKLEDDEDAPAVFNLISQDKGMFDCALVFNYKDDLGMHKTVEFFNVYIGRNTKYDIMFYLVAGIAAIVLGYSGYKKYYQK